jgi:hypothetical protein
VQGRWQEEEIVPLQSMLEELWRIFGCNSLMPGTAQYLLNKRCAVDTVNSNELAYSKLT